MTVIHRLDPAVFDDLAGGGGGTAAIEALRAAQLSKHLLLIGRLLAVWPGPPSEAHAVIDLLEGVRDRRPDVFRESLTAPHVGAWAAAVNRAVNRGDITWAACAYLNALAVTMCAASGLNRSAEVPLDAGTVTVPGRGVLTGIGGSARTVLRADEGQLQVRTADAWTEAGGGPAWLPLRHLMAGPDTPPIHIAVDDLDAYRHGHHAPASQRLPAKEFQRWQECFTEAWRLLTTCLPERAAEIASGLRALVPLVESGTGTARSATLRHTFGAFGLSRPASPSDFVVTLIHEFQHSKLSALLDLVQLTDPSDRRRYFAPWRTDPRPLAGLLQGVYAFIGVADAWRALSAMEGIERLAQARFAESRLQTDRGLTAIEASNALTVQGAALVTRLRVSTDRLLAVPVPDTVGRAAERSLADTWQRWLEHNGAR